MKHEMWEIIPGYDNLYSVSSLGRVRNNTMDVIIHPFKRHAYPYKQVHLYRMFKYTNKTVHILVANAFLPDRPNNVKIVHIDGNVLNNRADNLKYEAM